MRLRIAKCLIIFLFAVGTYCLTCDAPNYVIPTEPLDQAFDTTLDSIRSPQTLIAYIANPTNENFIDYTVTLLPAAAPLWAMGALTFLLFIACSIQMCCFDVCGKQACGNQMTTSTYSIRPIKILMCVVITFSVFVVIVCIIAIIINSGMIAAASFTGCNTILISQEIYNGSNTASTPWAGLNFFGAYIKNATQNLLNNQNFLISYFSPGSGSSNQFDNVTSMTAGSLYSNSQLYTCTASTVSLVCPFINSASCPSPLNAVFNQQFCNPSFTGSSLNLINREKQLNSTTWRDSIAALGSLLGGLDVSSASVNTTTTQIQQFGLSLDQYENQIAAASQGFDYSLYVVEIVLYVFYSFILLGAFTGIVTLSATYFCRKLDCKVSACVFWIFYVFMGTIVFLAAGFLLAATFISYDSCQAYGFYTKNSSNYNLIAPTINKTSPAVNSILDNCFFQNKKSVFDSFSANLKTQLSQMETLYQNSIPANSFSSVVTTIEQQLSNYAAYPTTVTFVNQNSTNSAAVALTQANNFANFSVAGQNQSCNKTRDMFVFNSQDCFPFSTSGTPPNNSCVVLSPPYVNSSTGSTLINTRAALFTSVGTTACNSQGSLYQQYADALWNYGASVRSMVATNLDISLNLTNPLHQYQSNYFNYYLSVSNFMSIPIQQQFNSFLVPFSQISSNSSCAFVTASFNGIVNFSCNQLFPYINAFSIINIILAACIFVLMSALYFLIPRLQFYAVLEGNFENWGEKSFKTEQLNATQMTNRNQDFLTSTDRQDV